MKGTTATHDGASERLHLVIEPGATSIAQYSRDLFHHRYLIRILALRELKLRYRQTLLGPIWIILQPVLSAGILSFVFGSVADLPTEGVPTFLFAYTGMLAWNAFSNNFSRTTSILLNNASLVAKVFFPRVVLPISTVFGVFVDFGTTFVLVLSLAWANGYPPTVRLLLIPVWIICLQMMSLGMGSVLGSLAVRYRDVVQVAPVVTQLLLYASPVAYAVTAVPSQYLTVYYLNPLVSLLEAFRWSMLGTPFPTAGHLAYSVALAMVLFFGGLFAMERMGPQFADVI
jgi:lipopolysaccharide transport system permease protein